MFQLLFQILVLMLPLVQQVQLVYVGLQQLLLHNNGFSIAVCLLIFIGVIQTNGAQHHLIISQLKIIYQQLEQIIWHGCLMQLQLIGCWLHVLLDIQLVKHGDQQQVIHVLQIRLFGELVLLLVQRILDIQELKLF